MARILDLTRPYAVYATRLMVETGHDLVRIEPPLGDEIRALGPHLDERDPLESSPYHLYWNAGKKSLAMDVSTAEGGTMLEKLAAQADAVIGSTPCPFDLESLARTSPALLVVLIEDAEPELCAYARSGLLSITGHPDRAPVLLGGHIPLAVPGLYAALALSAGLFAKQLTGRGQVVRLSAQKCLDTLLDQAMVDYTVLGKQTQRLGDRGAATALAGTFPSADGYWVLSVPHMPDGWRNFMDWVQDPELAKEKSLEDETEREARKEYVLGRLSNWARQFPTARLVEEAQARHVPASPIVTALELSSDPQLAARGFLTQQVHPTLGRIEAPTGAVATPLGRTVGRAPLLGEHSAELLQTLGYDAAACRLLVDRGIVFQR